MMYFAFVVFKQIPLRSKKRIEVSTFGKSCEGISFFIVLPTAGIKLNYFFTYTELCKDFIRSTRNVEKSLFHYD
jgi:hypothetical protein